jgi:hypothetical protein
VASQSGRGSPVVDAAARVGDLLRTPNEFSVLVSGVGTAGPAVVASDLVGLVRTS